MHLEHITSNSTGWIFSRRRLFANPEGFLSIPDEHVIERVDTLSSGMGITEVFVGDLDSGFAGESSTNLFGAVLGDFTNLLGVFVGELFGIFIFVLLGGLF